MGADDRETRRAGTYAAVLPLPKRNSYSAAYITNMDAPINVYYYFVLPSDNYR